MLPDCGVTQTVMASIIFLFQNTEGLFCFMMMLLIKFNIVFEVFIRTNSCMKEVLDFYQTREKS